MSPGGLLPLLVCSSCRGPLPDGSTHCPRCGPGSLALLGPDHAPGFRIAVEVAGLAPGLGEGTSKRIAEQAAAQALMEREGIGALPAAGPTETA